MAVGCLADRAHAPAVCAQALEGRQDVVKFHFNAGAINLGLRLKDVFDQINDGLRVENILFNLELAFLQLVEVKHVLDKGVDQV